MRPRGSPEVYERRRLEAIELLRQGRQPVEVARQVGVHRRTVRRWRATYEREGVAGLRARGNCGRPSRLTLEQKEQLKSELLRGARSAGFPTDLWTCPRVQKLIRTQFGVAYHVDHINRVLRSLGWSPQKPERRAVERDEQAIQSWVEKEWPRVKRGPVS